MGIYERSILVEERGRIGGKFSLQFSNDSYKSLNGTNKKFAEAYVYINIYMCVCALSFTDRLFQTSVWLDTYDAGIETRPTLC